MFDDVKAPTSLPLAILSLGYLPSYVVGGFMFYLIFVVKGWRLGNPDVPLQQSFVLAGLIAQKATFNIVANCIIMRVTAHRQKFRASRRDHELYH